MDILKKLKDLQNARGWSDYTLALESGLTQSTISSMFHRGTSPRVETLQLLCNAFGLTLAQFFTEEECTEMVTANEKALLEAYRSLSPQKQQSFYNLLSQ